MSCAQGNTAGRRARLLAALGSGLAIALTGCSAGQVAQTANQESAVNGARGKVGPIVLNNATLAFPAETNGRYHKGDDAPLLVAIANTGNQGDTLVSVDSRFVESATIEGDKRMVAHHAMEAVAEEQPAADATPDHGGSDAQEQDGAGATQGAATGTAAPPQGEQDTGESSASASATAGTEQKVVEHDTIRIVLNGLKAKVTPGQTVPVTFTFRKAGEITLDVPIGPATTERESSGHGEQAGGH